MCASIFRISAMTDEYYLQNHYNKYIYFSIHSFFLSKPTYIQQQYEYAYSQPN